MTDQKQAAATTDVPSKTGTEATGASGKDDLDTLIQGFRPSEKPKAQAEVTDDDKPVTLTNRQLREREEQVALRGAQMVQSQQDFERKLSSAIKTLKSQFEGVEIDDEIIDAWFQRRVGSDEGLRTAFMHSHKAPAEWNKIVAEHLAPELAQKVKIAEANQQRNPAAVRAAARTTAAPKGSEKDWLKATDRELEEGLRSLPMRRSG